MINKSIAINEEQLRHGKMFALIYKNLFKRNTHVFNVQYVNARLMASLKLNVKLQKQQIDRQIVY